MGDDFPIISTTQYIDEAEKWLKAISRGEDACVVFLPKTDREIRLGQLLSDRKLQQRVLGKTSSYVFLRVNFDSHDVEDVDDFSFQIQERLNSSSLLKSPLTFLEWMGYIKKHSMRVVLILPEAERYLNNSDKTALAVLSEVVLKYSPFLRVLSMFETNITHSSVMSFLPNMSGLYENIFYYPLYSIEATVSFIRLLCHQWHVSISRKNMGQIISACGGHFWLVKEAVRQISTTGNWSGVAEGMQFRLRSFYNLLLPSEQTGLYKLAVRQKVYSSEEQMSLSYLQTMNLVDSKRQFLIGELRNFLRNIDQISTNLQYHDHHVLLNEVPIEQMFSRKELRVFILLLEHGNTLVSRDEIAQRMWHGNVQEQYSDWAIDQLIARLRKRLASLSLPSRLIRAVRGRGYVLKLS